MSLFLFFLASLVAVASASYSIHQANGAIPYFLFLNYGNKSVAINDGVFIGERNSSLTAASTDGHGQITNNGTSGTILAKMITPTIARVEVNTTSTIVSARFVISNEEKVYGLWEYPWGGSLHNRNVSFELKGVGNAEGINWNNARAPFWISSDGYGVYTDTLAMGSYDFKNTPNRGQFTFNSSNLVYYIILAKGAPTNIKSILSQYMELSAKIEMPPDSAYGPTFWSDDFEQDFHGSVSNAEQNYYDVVDHLYYNKIHATSMFADRPYGTGNNSFGNMDFDPKFYPNPVAFIANLTTWGYDFQVWVANRAFKDTKMYQIGKSKQWLFPGIDPDKFLGPALDLRIQEAYIWMKDALKSFTAMGVKGFKIDRGEEGEMPGKYQPLDSPI
jgi:alpha-D-xyloside xylohydrolase